MKPRSTVRWPRLETLSLAALLFVVSACSSNAGIEDSEAQFEQAYLQPIDGSGLGYSVEEVCHYDRVDPGEAWHFQVTLVIEAEPDEVADVIEDQVEVILRDRDPMVIQQYAGEPNRGWDGLLESRAGATVLGVVKNNVTVDGDRPPLGWLGVCEQTEQ